MANFFELSVSIFKLHCICAIQKVPPSIRDEELRADDLGQLAGTSSSRLDPVVNR
jgi:hypothetical protein